MIDKINSLFDDIVSFDREKHYQAYLRLMEMVEEKVSWAEEVWETVVAKLTHKDAHVRSTSAQMLFKLAKSENSNLFFKDFDKIKQVLLDQKFVTQRHALNTLYEVALIDEAHFVLVVEYYRNRFISSKGEKNGLLIRSDIVSSLLKVYQATSDKRLENVVDELIALETEPKLIKKYRLIWSKK